jgi:predicted RNase H-like HicB family nuclease
VEEAERLLREAIELHIAGMREDGVPVPAPSSVVDYVEVSS